MTETESPLVPIVRKYFENDPVQAARSLETLHEEVAAEIVKSVPPALSVKVIRHLPHAFAARLLRQVPAGHLKGIVEELEPEQGASIFLELPDKARRVMLDSLEERQKRQIQELLTYPVNSAGHLMVTDVLALHGDLKVSDAIQKIREMAQSGGQSSYVYVVDAENHLIGVMNMRDMLLAGGGQRLSQVMRQDVFAIHCFADRGAVAGEFLRRRFFAMPVVDHENKLLGAIKAERIIRDVREEASGDIQKMFGAGENERAFSPVGLSLRKRLPWLYVNLATAFLAGWVVSIFQDLIAKIAVLAIYLPVVAGQGGNAGAQSLAVVMRGLVMREIPAKRATNLILKETWIGAVNGILIGVVTALGAYFWQGNPFLGLVVGLGMFVNLTVAGLSGAAIPIAMKGIGLDPAQCSNIILTTVTDVIGFLAFLGFAVMFKGYLV